ASGAVSGSATVTVSAASPGLADGGFEAPAVGAGRFQYAPTGTPWSYAGAAGVSSYSSGFTAGNPNAPEGAQVAFLQATGSFSQSVAFTAGTYSLSFRAAPRGNLPASSPTLPVLEDGNGNGTLTPPPTNYDSYTTNSFTVTSGAHVITFAGLDPDGQDNTAFIDQATINAVPILGNAGFETPNVGTGTYGAFRYNPSGSPWTFDNGSGVAGNGSGFTAGNPGAPQGTQVAFLQATGPF